jgi:hypothetical protein
MTTPFKTFLPKQVYFSRKGPTVGLIIWGIIALLVVLLFIPLLKGMDNIPWIAITLIGLVILLLTWIWFGTYYILTPYYLRYYSGPFRGRIPMTSILWVKHQHSLASGLRIALAYDGLLIRYNKYDEIYISPAQKAAFIYTLQQFNPNIKVRIENEF